jgi:Flp pilus assembly protein TadD
MLKLKILTAARLPARAAMLFGLAAAGARARAIYRQRAAPALAAGTARRAGRNPAAALARAVRMLAQSPRDFPALIAAGRAALDLGDMQAAIGFFGRAEEVRPSDPAPKIGMGAATVATGDASGALSWFYQAQQLGATAIAIGADRGLAQDLLGNQPAAQIDYRAALGGRDADEARRRLALSLGISGDRNGAFSILQPLLMRRDPAAQRIRAFVLALVGDERGASSAIDSAMPGSGARMAGFFRLLPTCRRRKRPPRSTSASSPTRARSESPRSPRGPSRKRRAARWSAAPHRARLPLW